MVVLTENFKNDPLPGARIEFEAPGSNASAKLSAKLVVTNSAGQASVAAKANSIAGSYVVTAKDSRNSSLSATFDLTNSA